MYQILDEHFITAKSNLFMNLIKRFRGFWAYCLAPRILHLAYLLLHWSCTLQNIFSTVGLSQELSRPKIRAGIVRFSGRGGALVFSISTVRVIHSTSSVILDLSILRANIVYTIFKAVPCFRLLWVILLYPYPSSRSSYSILVLSKSFFVSSSSQKSSQHCNRRRSGLYHSSTTSAI